MARARIVCCLFSLYRSCPVLLSLLSLLSLLYLPLPLPLPLQLPPPLRLCVRVPLPWSFPAPLVLIYWCWYCRCLVPLPCCCLLLGCGAGPKGTEDTITLLTEWENTASGNRGTALYTASWSAPKADVHSQQRFHYMGTGGEMTVDQAHRNYHVCTHEDGYVPRVNVSCLIPPLSHYPREKERERELYSTTFHTRPMVFRCVCFSACVRKRIAMQFSLYVLVCPAS